MKLYAQFMITLVSSSIGEAISNLLHLLVPGSIIGLVLLFLALEFKIIRLRHIDVVGNFSLNNMTILFLPVAVGITEKFNDIKDYLFSTTIIILGAILLNVSVIGFVAQFIKKRFEGDYVDKGVRHE